MELIPKQFDREWTLRDLLAGLPASRLDGALEAMFGSAFRLVAGDGFTMAGNSRLENAALRIPLCLELEPIGYLETVADDPRKAKAAAALIELLLHSSARYYMASALHIE